jgi:tRNA-2-methylthio-N6-dimethylallyladenosine synthase
MQGDRLISAVIRKVRFDKVHAAAYSTRDGTIAARTMSDDVPGEVKKERLKAIEELQRETLTEINAALEGQTVEVLVEDRKRGRWFGRNRNDKLVYFDDERDLRGQLVDVKVESAGPWSLQGVAAAWRPALGGAS